MSMEVYDKSFANRDNVIRTNHGKPWTDSQQASLRQFFLEKSTNLQWLAETMGRSGESILARLRALDLIIFDKFDCCDYYTPKTTQETIMSETTKNIEVKTLIAGVDAESMSDNDIFKQIGRIESEISKLEAIITRPKKLTAVIEALHKDIEALVAYVDAR